MRNKMQRFGSTLVITALVFPLIILEHTGHIFDVLTTWYALTRCGAREGNIFLTWFLHSQWRWRWLTLSAVKVAVVNLNHPVTRTYKRSYDMKHAAIFTAMIWAVVLWNFSVILRKRHAISA